MVVKYSTLKSQSYLEVLPEVFCFFLMSQMNIYFENLQHKTPVQYQPTKIGSFYDYQ